MDSPDRGQNENRDPFQVGRQMSGGLQNALFGVPGPTVLFGPLHDDVSAGGTV